MIFNKNHRRYRVVGHDNVSRKIYIKHSTIFFEVDTLNNRGQRHNQGNHKRRILDTNLFDFVMY